MNEIRNELENLSGKIYDLGNLSTLLEDYFFEYRLDRDTYNKNQTLSTVVKDKVKQLNEEVNLLFKKTWELEKGVKENETMAN